MQSVTRVVIHDKSSTLRYTENAANDEHSHVYDSFAIMNHDEIAMRELGRCFIQTHVQRRLFVAAIVLAVGTALFAQKSNVNPSTLNRRPATSTKVISAQNVVELRKHVGSDVTITGQVSRATRSKSGHQFLNFASSELSAVCFKEYGRNFTKGQPVDLYRSKRVELHGKLELYKNKLQIKLMKPEQIRLVATTAGQSNTGSKGKPLAVTDYLKRVGENTWISPAGLKYTGHDPEGLTRVEHVLRHARDIPNRRGSHGVFDDAKGNVFQVIDEAWKTGKKRKTRPTVEGDRSTYTINMGRRIGYLGGTNGKRRRNPALNRVFIVVRTDTQEVVTAFPK